MKKDAQAVPVSPLMGTERAFFDAHKERLCRDYAVQVQTMVDDWEASSETVGALRKKRFLEVGFLTFFGRISFRVRQGVDAKGQWVSPALAHLGIRPHQRHSPDTEKRMAVLAVETGSYEKAAAVAEATWLTISDEAVRMGLARAKAVFFVMDGGVWLWNIYTDRFKKCSKAMLDFYHLSQHLHALGAALHGTGSAEAAAWCGKILHDLKHKSPKRLFKTLDQLLQEPPSEDPAVLDAIREQNVYFRNHAAHMDYAKNAAQGVPIGSGSVESLCSQFQNRLKRTGQFWTKTGFAALLRVTVRHWNREMDSLWPALAA